MFGRCEIAIKVFKASLLITHTGLGGRRGAVYELEADPEDGSLLEILIIGIPGPIQEMTGQMGM